MQEHNLIVKLLLFEYEGRFVDTKAKQLDEFTKAALAWMQAHEGNNEDALVGPYSEARDRVHDTLEILTPEFEDKDKLLSKQGEIPIYYWTARQHPNWINELHDFVLRFTTELNDTLQEQKINPNAGDRELSHYYTMSRTTNDQASLEGRYKIFSKRFAAFRRPRR